MSDFVGPDGNGYSFPQLPATGAAWSDWEGRTLQALSGGSPGIFMPGNANKASVARMPTAYLTLLVQAGCLTSP